ncbi:hypothetical protein BGZ74_010290 [Mortierella antarctica]|nr:hypothetical protein BGZ74_010290 [Mortierella antarctica]
MLANSHMPFSDVCSMSWALFFSVIFPTVLGVEVNTAALSVVSSSSSSSGPVATSSNAASVVPNTPHHHQHRSYSFTVFLDPSSFSCSSSSTSGPSPHSFKRSRRVDVKTHRRIGHIHARRSRREEIREQNQSGVKDDEQILSRMTERNIKIRTHDDSNDLNLHLDQFKVMRSILRHVSHCPPLLHELFDNPSSGKSFHPSERIDHSAEPTFDKDSDADADADEDENGDNDNANSHLDNDRIVWQGHVHSGWNLAPGMRDKPSKPDLVSLTGLLLGYPLTAPLHSYPAQWIALIRCSGKTDDHVRAVFKAGAKAAVLYADTHGIGNLDPTMPIFTLEYDTGNYLISVLGKLPSGSATVAISAEPLNYAKEATIQLSATQEHIPEQSLHRHAGSVLDSIRSGAGIARRMLTRLGLDTEGKRDCRDKLEKEDKTMISTPFIPRTTLLSNAPLPRTHDDRRLDRSDKGQPQTERARAFSPTATPDNTPHKPVGPTKKTEYDIKPSRLLTRLYSFSPSKFIQDASNLAKDDSMTGKLAMVLMSTVCGVGVGMFGALLFVVALKVRLFQTRRGQNNHPHQTATQQHQAHQLLREHGYKKVIPKGILDSFGVQTVLHTSTTTMTTSLKSDMFKAKPYAEDVIEMEEGFNDLAAREVARQQRLRTRSHLLRGFSDQGRDLGEREQTPGLEADDGQEDEESQESEWEVFEGEEIEEIGHATTTDGSTMDMDQITAAIMSATRRGSYRRFSLRDDSSSPAVTSSTTTSASLSLSLSLSSSEKPKGCSSSHHEHEHDKKLPFANANAQTMCAICLAEYEVGDQVRTLPCYHQYHQACIDPWLLHVASLCPICKQDLWPSP